MAIIEYDLEKLTKDRRNRLIDATAGDESPIAGWIRYVMGEVVSGFAELLCESWSEEELQAASRTALGLRNVFERVHEPEGDFLNWILIILEETWEDRNTPIVAF